MDLIETMLHDLTRRETTIRALLKTIRKLTPVPLTGLLTLREFDQLETALRIRKPVHRHNKKAQNRGIPNP